MLAKFKTQNFINSIPQSGQLTQCSKRFFRVRFPRAKPTVYDQERINYKQVLHEYRLKNIREYWERQTQIENNYIEKFHNEREQKRKDDLVRFRNSIVKISAGTKQKIEERDKNFEKSQNVLRGYLTEEYNKQQNRLHMVKMMNLDSKDWFSLENIEEKMKAQVIIPDFIYDQTSYYIKLQEQASYLEQGNYEALEKSQDPSELIKFKNSKISPIYAQIVGVIKHIRTLRRIKCLKSISI